MEIPCTGAFLLHKSLVTLSECFVDSAEEYEHIMAASCNPYQKGIECTQRVILVRHSDMSVCPLVCYLEVHFMSSPLLEVKDLQVTVGEEQKVLLNGLNLTIYPGETHVLMGHNGAGKSTLMSALMGDPRYTVTRGQILFRGQDVTHEPADVRARAGMFLSFQTPEEIPGITLENFLRTAQNAITGKPVKVFAFRKELAKQMEALGMDPSYADRYLNVGFSGGEKKKSEILQLLMLKPKLALLDETDSGLDVDAVKTVAQGVRAYHNSENALIIITHNAKILEGLKVDYVHVLDNAHIVRTGGDELVNEIIEEGFHAVKEDEAK